MNKCMNECRDDKKNGFTLVELLVVITILSILMAVLLPTVVGGRESANALACKKRLEQINAALTKYTGYSPYAYPFKGDGVEPAISDSKTYWQRLVDKGILQIKVGTDVSKIELFQCPFLPGKLGYGAASGNINDSNEYEAETPIAGDEVSGTKSPHGPISEKSINVLLKSGNIIDMNEKSANWSSFTGKVMQGSGS